MLFAFLVSGYSVLSHFAREYIPSIRVYLTPSFAWELVRLGIVAGAVCIVVGVFIYTRFTNRGRRWRLLRLLRLIRQYNRFSHEKEMEVVSRIHSRTWAAALVFLMTLLLASPLAIEIIYLFGAAIIGDITNNIKGTHIRLAFGPQLFFNVCAIALGLSFSWILHLLESARLESLLLSAKYRRKMIVDWQARIVKIKFKLRKQTCKKALAQCASTSA